MLTAQADALEKRLHAATQIRTIPDEEFSLRPAPGKWSKKEIIGHLIDSAQNNLRRFVVTQYEDTPNIVYAQDDWVRILGYQDMHNNSLIDLWVLLNQRLAYAFRNLDPALHEKQCNTGKGAPELHTLAWLADDYLVHMDHHLKAIL